VCSVLLLTCAAPIVFEQSRFAAWQLGAIDRDAYYDAYGEPGSEMKAVRWLRTEGRPGKVFVFGWNASIAWLSEREIVSRFGFSMPLLTGGREDIRSRYRAEVLAALRSDPPAYIVEGTVAEQIVGTHLTIDDFPELADLVRNAYREVVRFDTVVIHERRQP
jgi:hypothetical protein